MRLLALAVLLAAACSRDPESNFPDPSSLYRIDGLDVYCNGASSVTHPPEAVPPYLTIWCSWDCVTVDGRAVRRVGLTFARDDVSSPWRETFAAWDFGICD